MAIAFRYLELSQGRAREEIDQRATLARDEPLEVALGNEHGRGTAVSRNPLRAFGARAAEDLAELSFGALNLPGLAGGLDSVGSRTICIFRCARHIMTSLTSRYGGTFLIRMSSNLVVVQFEKRLVEGMP